jgi:hypothetical protein
MKKFLEMRGADSGPFRRICALPAFWVGLLYDDQAQQEALAMVSVSMHLCSAGVLGGAALRRPGAAGGLGHGECVCAHAAACALPAFWVVLLYDDQAQQEALAMVSVSVHLCSAGVLGGAALRRPGVAGGLGHGECVCAHAAACALSVL